MIASIIISTYKRPELLKHHLDSLVRQKNIQNCEILIMNDGVEDTTKDVYLQYSDKLNLRYFFTGQRNAEIDTWRVPGFCLNIGVKQSVSDIIFISCAEMYLMEDDVIDEMIKSLQQNKRRLVITNGKDDNGTFLKCVNTTGKNINVYKSLPPLNTKIPFYMAIWKDNVIQIGGYDEDFIGVGFEDNDLVERLKKFGCVEWKIDRNVIHLYHKRFADMQDKRFHFNCNLFRERKNKIVRNQNKDWGIL